MAKNLRRQKSDLIVPGNNESWYDLIEDYDLIEASFAKQYGIRLRNELDMDWGEFTTLLAGIMQDTPLGNIVSIRAENDPQIIKNFSKEQKRIRSEWRKNIIKDLDKNEYEEAMKSFANIFRQMI